MIDKGLLNITMGETLLHDEKQHYKIISLNC